MQKNTETMAKNNAMSNNGNNNSFEQKSLTVLKTPLNNNELFTSPEYTLILPDINIQPADFREFLKRDLLETTTLVSLEIAGRLNWWVDLGVCRRLFPLVTTGDGNCLLHAASLALFGRHDNKLILRSALNRMMSNVAYKNAFFRRWRWNQTILNKQSELVFTEEEWKEEWKNLSKMASAQPRMSSNNNNSVESNEENERKNKNYYNGFGDDYEVNFMEGNSVNGGKNFTKNNGNNFNNNYNTVQSNFNRPSTKPPAYNYNTIPNNNNNLLNYNYSSNEEYEMDEMLYESLEEFHVFVLAHVLRRPIIIVADTILKNLNGEPLAPISFGGIYLPLEIPPSECCKSPLLLTYDAAHFSALVPMEDSTKSIKLADAIPLVDPDFELLPVHFAYDPGNDFQWGNEDISPNIENLLHLPDDKLHLLKILKSYMDIRFLGVPYSGDLEEEGSPNNPRNSLHDSGIASNSPCSSNINASRDGSHGENSIATCSASASKQSKKENDGGSTLKQQNPSQASSCTSKNNRKFLSLRKRLGKTFKFGLCASGIKREVEDDKEDNDKSVDAESDLKQKTSEKKPFAVTNKKPHAVGNSDEHIISNMPQQNYKNSNSDWAASDSIKNHVLSDATNTPTQNITNAHNKLLTPVSMQPDVSDNELPSDDLTQLKCADSILCTKLFHKRDKAQDLILKKYIQVAKERFKLEGCRKENQCCSYVNCREHQHTQQLGIQHQHQQNCNVINTNQTSTTASTALKGNQNNGSLKGGKGKFENMSCINVGCEGKGGNPDMSYLCEECFVRQKQEEIDLTLKFSDKKHEQQQIYNSHSFPQKQLQNQLKFNNSYSNQFPKSTSVFINNQPSTHSDNHWSNNNISTNNSNKKPPSAELLKQTTYKNSHPVTITSASASYSSSSNPFNSKTFLDTSQVPKIDSTFENVRKNTGYTLNNNKKYNTRSNLYNYKNNFYNDKNEQMKSSNPGINKLGKVYEVKRETSLSSTPSVTSHFFTQLQDRKVLQNNNMTNNINIKNNNDTAKNCAVVTSDYENFNKDFDGGKRLSKTVGFDEFIDDSDARHAEELRSLLPTDSATSSNIKFYNYKSSFEPDASNDKGKFVNSIADHQMSTQPNAIFRTEKKFFSDRMHDNVRDFDRDDDDDDDDYSEKWKERERNIIMRALNNNDNALTKDATRSDNKCYSKKTCNKNMVINKRVGANKTLGGVKLVQANFKDNETNSLKSSIVYHLPGSADLNYRYHEDDVYNDFDKDGEDEDSNSIVNIEKSSFNVGSYNDKNATMHYKGNTNIHMSNKTGNINRANDRSGNRNYEIVNELPQHMINKQNNSKNYINTISVHKDYSVHNSQEGNKDPWAKLQRV